MFDVQVIRSPVKIGNGNALTATKIGKMKRTIIQKNGDTADITLTEVKYVEDLWVNLFSIGKGLQNGFNIGNKGNNIFLMKERQRSCLTRSCGPTKGSYLESICYLAQGRVAWQQ
jgi:hypothetical protein